MASTDTPAYVMPVHPDEDLIELEPTVVFEGGFDDPTRRSSPVGIGHVDAGSLTNETNSLRRRRIGACALFLAVAYGILSLWGLVFGGTEVWLITGLLAVRFVICAGVVGLIFSQVFLSPFQVRLVEYLLFGSVMIVMCLAQYIIDVDLVHDGEPIGMVVYAKNGVIQLFVLMVLYGIFIPNTARSAAYVVLSMALALTATFTAVGTRPDVEPILERMKMGEGLITNDLLILLGAGLAIFGAHVVNGLRTELHEAKKFGQYRLGRKIGAGGMGEVYLAEHELLKRPCALKLIRPEAGGDPLALARFEREVQSSARLNHPNTIDIYDYGHTDDGTFYYVMEYLTGLSLSDLVLKYGPMPAGRLIYLMRQVCGGLYQAHILGLIHRDLKPGNIFIAHVGGECDVAKILDFGLVKITKGPDSADLTSDQRVSGTPAFMPPEQATGSKNLDPRADIYALGAIAYACLTGQPPFLGGTPIETMISLARDPVVPPSKLNPRIPKDLEQVILRCLEKKPEARYPDVKALSKALAACESASEWDADRAEEWWKATPAS